MNTVIDFLRRLKANNNREWFNSHKSEFIEAQNRFHTYVADVLNRLSAVDTSVGGLEVKDCTYRIYRDVRFSKDKSPYKTHFGAYVCPGGKKSGFAGYYFHVGVGGHGYPDGHMLAVGDYICEPRVLKVLREDIQDDGEVFDSIVQKAAKAGYMLDDTYKLKKVPQGFDKDSPWSDYFKYKVYCLYQEPDEDLFTGPDNAERTADLLLQGQPFLSFINRAVEYVKEGYE